MIFGRRLKNRRAGICRYEVAIDVSQALRIATETLWLKPEGRAAPERERTDFPNPPEPPARIVTDSAQRAPAGWKRIVSRGSEPERVTFRAETSARPITLNLPADRPALATRPGDAEPSRLRTVSGGCSSPAWGASRPGATPCVVPARPAAPTTIVPTPRICLTSSTRWPSRPPSATRTALPRPRGASRRREHHDHQASGRRASLSRGPLPQRTRSAVVARL